MSVRRNLFAAAAALALLPGAARADERDLYVLLHGGPAFLRLTDPVEGTATTSSPAGSLGLTSYYGLSDTLHLGLSLSGTKRSGVKYPGLAVVLENGTRPEGDFYEDHLRLGAAALAHYRFNTGRSWAPFAQLELGGAQVRRTNLQEYVTGTRRYAAPAGDTSTTQLVPVAAAQLGLELRFLNNWSASVGLQAGTSLGSQKALQIHVPLSIGYIFRP